MEKEKLLQYLETVRNLRAEEYVLGKTIEKLKINYSVCSNRSQKKAYQSLKYPKLTIISFYYENNVRDKLTAFSVIFFVASFVINILIQIIFDTDDWDSGLFFIYASGIVIIVATMGIVKFCLLDYFKARKKEVEYVKRENERIQQENARAMAWDKLQVQLIPKENDYLAQKRLEVQSVLNSYLRKGILHRDYQDLVAVCSIYQYIESGRCNTLGEAYNLYTDECFKKLVINKLDTILEKLSEIRQTQTELYRTIQSCNSQISSLTKMMEGINSNIERIEENSAVSAYNAELLRRNEEYRSLLHNY